MDKESSFPARDGGELKDAYNNPAYEEGGIATDDSVRGMRPSSAAV